MEPTTPPVEKTTTPQASSSYLKRLFSGRLNRQNFIAGTFILYAVPFVCYVIFVISVFSSPAAQQVLLNNPYDTTQLQNIQESATQDAIKSIADAPLTMVLGVFMVLYTLAALPFAFSLQMRRLHDLDKSGWWMLLGFVPIINYFFPLYVTFFGGTEGENKFGPKPLARTSIKNDIFLLS